MSLIDCHVRNDQPQQIIITVGDAKLQKHILAQKEFAENYVKAEATRKKVAANENVFGGDCVVDPTAD